MSESADSAPAADAGPAAPGPGPGARLRSAREQRGLALGAVAESLHVAPRLVAAMEANDFAAFDAPVYAKGFLRKYAAVLGLPPEEVLAAYEAVAGAASAPTLIPALNVAPPKAALPPVPVVPALIAAAIVLAGAGLWWWSARPRVAATAPPAATEAARPAEGAAMVAVPPAAEETAVAAAAPPAETRSRPAETAPLVLPLPAATPRRGAAGAAHGETLVVHGIAECWVEVYAPSGARLVYDLVHPGETRTAPGPGPWKVFLGHADGARLTVGERTVAVPPSRRAATTARFVVARDGAAQ